MSRQERTAKRSTGIVLSYIHTGLNMICGLFLSSFLLRMLGDTDYGIYQTIASFANYLILFEFGTGTVVTRNLLLCRHNHASKEEIARNVSTIVTITHILALAILLVSGVFYASIGKIYSASLSLEQISYGRLIFVFVTMHLLFSFYSQTFNGIIIAYEHYTFQSKTAIARLIIRTGLLVVLIMARQYSLLIAIVDSILSMIYMVYSLLYCKRRFKFQVRISNFSKEIFQQSLPLCFAIFLQSIVNQANNNVDKFILGIKMTPEVVAIYSVGMYIYSIFSSLTTIPISMYAPSVSKAIADGRQGRRLTEALIQPCRLTALVGGAVLFGFITIGKPFVNVVYGTGYLDAYYVAVIIMIPMFINMTNGVLVNVLDILNKRMTRSIILLGTTLVNIVLTILWIDYWGMIGASVATAIATLAGQVILMNLYYKRGIGIHIGFLFREAYRGILIYQLLAMLLTRLVLNFISNDVYALFIGGCIFAVVFLCGYVLRGTNSLEKSMMHSMIYKLKRKSKG